MPHKKRPQAIGGIKAAAELLSRLDAKTREKLISNVAKRAPGIAIEIEKQLFSFDDLALLNDKALQILLREIPQQQLATALRKTTPEIKDTFMRNLSKNSQSLLREEMDAQGLRRISEVERAQDEIIQTAKRLSTEGKISLEKKNQISK